MERGRRTSRQKSREALDQVRRLGPQLKQVEKREPVQEVVLEPEAVESVTLRSTFINSSFPEVIPQSSNTDLQMFEDYIATGRELFHEDSLDELLKRDLEGVSLAMVRGIRRWKDYLHS